jgi:aldehyde dehydrogenase (NAD+)
VGAAVTVCHSHAGQGCALSPRIFIPQDHKEYLIAKIATQFSSIRVGPADDPNTQIGPVIAPLSVNVVKLALAAGARLIAGGKRPQHPDLSTSHLHYACR